MKFGIQSVCSVLKIVRGLSMVRNKIKNYWQNRAVIYNSLKEVLQKKYIENQEGKACHKNLLKVLLTENWAITLMSEISWYRRM